MDPEHRWEEIKEVIKKESRKYEKEKIKNIFKEKSRLEKEIKYIIDNRHKMSEKMWFDEYFKTQNKIRKEQRKEDTCTRTNATYRFQCSMGTSSRKAL